MSERDIFLAAIEIADPAERAAYVDQACGGDTALRAQVEELLKTHEQTSQFLETPAAAVNAAGTETLVGGGAPADVDPEAETSSGEDEFRQHLEPSTRSGWLGRLGHYEIEEILGRGAFGIVAKAFDEKLHRVVAVKMLNPELAATSPPRKRFLREARSAAAVAHENIVGIHAVEEDPVPHLVMEYIPGQTLQQRLDHTGPLDVSEVLRIGEQIAAGLAAAHAVNLIHRDIKPSNILLGESPADRARISDFGLARAVDDASLTSSGLVAGTPMYMAPEQARSEPLDHRADLFSLGSVLYQMVSGRPRFRAANTVAVLKRVCEDSPRPINDVIPETPDWLCKIIFRLLEKDPDDRYQSAQELADLLARCRDELQHNGKVTCVDSQSGTAATQVYRPEASTASGSRKKPIAWLVGGVIAVAAAIGVLIVNGRGKSDPERNVANAPGDSKTDATTVSTANSDNAAGWHGWPDEAPPPAIAPFNAEEARQHQQAWAEYLGIPVEYENSIGMKFRLIPPGEYLMGSTLEEIEAALNAAGDNPLLRKGIQSEAPQHKVMLTQPVYVGVTEVTQSQYEQVMGINPSYFSTDGDGQKPVTGLDTGNHPVEMVSWIEAVEFCTRLSQQEQLKPFYFRSGRTVTPLDGTGYRLPSEAEWEYACSAGTTTRFWSGEQDHDLLPAAWFNDNSRVATHAVGQLRANPFGLFDIHGNVREWVQDKWDPTFYGAFAEKVATDPSNPFHTGSDRVYRGGHWRDAAFRSRTSDRYPNPATYRDQFVGFRLALTVDAVKQLTVDKPAETTSPKPTTHNWPEDAPAPAIAPFDAEKARQHQEAWAEYLGVPVEYENTIGMKFRLIPPGEFLMGSAPEEIEAALETAGDDETWRARILSEAPQHKVILTQPLYIAVTEVTQAQYEQVMGTNPSHFSASGEGKVAVANMETGNHPVEMVDWHDAAEFCIRLSQQEQLKPFYFRSGLTVTPLEGAGYRLPTEAEWEYACRAGSTSRYWSGDQESDVIQAGWFTNNSGKRTHAVGELRANPFGLFDVHGNVAEWVQDGWNPDFYGRFAENAAVDPTSPFFAGSQRVLRGGGWINISGDFPSSIRFPVTSSFHDSNVGIRVVLTVEAVKTVTGDKPAETTNP